MSKKQSKSTKKDKKNTNKSKKKKDSNEHKSFKERAFALVLLGITVLISLIIYLLSHHQ